MTDVYFNQAEEYRIKKVEEFVPGRKYLMVHNRADGDRSYFPPECSEVLAIGTEFTSFATLDERVGKNRIVRSDHALENRWFLFYVGDNSGYVNLSCCSEHGFTESVTSAHTVNYILDLDALKAKDITILRSVSPGTDMGYEPDYDYDLYSPYN